MSFVETALAVASTAASVIGSLQQGQSAKAAANYNARVAENNAIAARQAAAAEAARERDRALRLTGAQRAAYAKGGVTMSGSALDVIGDTAAQAELDALTILYGGEARARAAEADAAGQRYAGRQAQSASYAGAGSALLTGASRIYKTTLPRKTTLQPDPFENVG